MHTTSTDMATATRAVLFALLLTAAASQTPTVNLFLGGATEAQFFLPVDTPDFFALPLVTNPDLNNLVTGAVDGIEAILTGGSGDSLLERIEVDGNVLPGISLESTVVGGRYTYMLTGDSVTVANYSTLLFTLSYVSNLTSAAFNDPPRSISIAAFNGTMNNGPAITAFITPILDNEEDPVFVDGENIEIFIEENSVGVVTTIVANDPDNIAFSLSEPSDVFSIDSASGDILVTDTSALDYEVEANRFFEITVVATDQYQVVERRRSAEAMVTIRLNNTNDERPVFINTPYVFSVVEEAAGAFVGQLEAVDADNLGPLFFDFVSGGATGIIFSLNRGTGEIHVLNALDFEDIEFYEFDVLVNDGGGIVSESVRVDVLDIADNRPVISPAGKEILLNLDMGVNEVYLGLNGTGGPLTVTDVDSPLQRGIATISVVRNGNVSFNYSRPVSYKYMYIVPYTSPLFMKSTFRGVSQCARLNTTSLALS